MIRLLAAALLSGLASVAACAQPLTVSAAASLSDAFKQIAREFESRHPGVDVRLNFGASGALLLQIARGAPVDVLASADDTVIERGLAQGWLQPGSRLDFAGNVLVLAVPRDTDRHAARVDSLAQLTEPGVKRIAIGKSATVPAGGYATRVLEKAGTLAALAPKFVQADSARQVLDYVARGEVDAGFVYRTDALMAAEQVRIAETLSLNPPIRYPAAVVAESRRRAVASAFVDFLASPAAQRALARFGFTSP